MPITTNPVSTSTFDKVWIKNIVISGQPTTTTKAIITLQPYDGTNTLDKTITFCIEDVFSLANSDQTFANCLCVLLAEIERQAKNRNII